MLRNEVGELNSAARKTSGAKTAPDARVRAPGPTRVVLSATAVLGTNYLNECWRIRTLNRLTPRPRIFAGHVRQCRANGILQDVLNFRVQALRRPQHVIERLGERWGTLLSVHDDGYGRRRTTLALEKRRSLNLKPSRSHARGHGLRPAVREDVAPGQSNIGEKQGGQKQNPAQCQTVRLRDR